jgi:ABC-2 type transport system permease protein
MSASMPELTQERSRRPGAFAELLNTESRLAWRNPRGLLIGLGFPVVLLLLFGELPHFHQRLSAYGGLTRFDVELPTLATMVVAALALLSLPSPLAAYREQGILRRMSITPVSPGWVLAAQLVVNVLLAFVGEMILFTLGVAAFGVTAPKDAGALALSLALCTAALFAIGLSIAAVARSASLPVISAATFFPLVFLAGLWIPVAQMPTALGDISKYSPLGAAVRAAQDAMQGTFPPTSSLLVMAAYAVVFGLCAWRFFRWE